MQWEMQFNSYREQWKYDAVIKPCTSLVMVISSEMGFLKQIVVGPWIGQYHDTQIVGTNIYFDDAQQIWQFWNIQIESIWFDSMKWGKDVAAKSKDWAEMSKKCD